MSNFTTFFPSGGSGGGGINSYAPFKVTATDNPVGYNATTGLYTNSVDASVWLKTGNTIVDSASSYPNATGPSNMGTASGFTFSTTSETSFPTGITFDSVNSFYYVADRIGSVYQYNTAGVYTGVNWSIGFSNSTGITYYGGNIYICDKSGNRVVEYTTAGVATGFTFSVSTQLTQPQSVWRDATHYYVGRFQVYQYTTAGVYTGLYGFNTTNVVNGLVSDGTNNLYAIENNSRVDTLYLSTGQPTGQTFNFSTTNQDDITLNASNNFVTVSDASNNVTEWYGPDARLVGDSTARTDASGSGQPLFIKLK